MIDRTEFDRQYRVIDQLLTMHSVLRDRYKRWSTTMSIAVLVFSVVGTAFAFATGATTFAIGPVSALRATWLGWLAVAVFTLSVVELRVDWAGKAREHATSVQRLGDLKNRYRGASLTGADATDELAELGEEYARVMASITHIPDSRFLQLKAVHVRKVELSRMIDKAPGVPLWRLRLRLWRGRQRPTSGP